MNGASLSASEYETSGPRRKVSSLMEAEARKLSAVDAPIRKVSAIEQMNYKIMDKKGSY